MAVAGGSVEQREVIAFGCRIRDVTVHRDGSVRLLTEHEDSEVLRLTPAGEAAIGAGR
ncbi:hypothetical protein GCM10010964_30890 [Caldovatus sediminis]|uniref:Uncharacterized protein n=1 Tax=Caldovatus sediminis TaxID=2041189 RepID=A0A8J2ZCL4_9PROT|nr:hypothetical protein GCM10010964_30890 [Caldovatus sediminis]